MKTSITSLTLIFALLSLSQLVAAQKSSFTPEHEFRLGIGAYPLAESLGYLYHNNGYMTSFGYGNAALNDYEYISAQNYTGPKKFTGSISAGYTFNVLRWLSVGATFTYAGGSSKVYDRITDQQKIKYNDNHFYLMPVIRFNYFSRPLIRLYSQIGVGLSYVSYKSQENNVTTVTYTEKGLAAQVTLFGVSVGKQLFGFAEFLGTGVQGSLVVGIGYKFNTKNR